MSIDVRILERKDSNQVSQMKFYKNMIDLKNTFQEHSNSLTGDLKDFISIGSNEVVNEEQVKFL